MGLREVEITTAKRADVWKTIQKETKWRHMLTFNGVKYSNMLQNDIDALFMYLAANPESAKPKKKAASSGRSR